MNEGTDEETMIRILENATMVDLEDSRPFMPHEKLLEICNEQAMAKELARVFPEHDPNTNERLTRSICHGQIQGPYMTSNSCRKTFAILVLIQQVRAIELFLRHQFCDDDLPLRNASDFPVLQSSREGPGNELHIPDGFNQYELINNFIEKQWLVLPPDLKKGKMRSVPFPQPREDTLNDLWNKHPHDIITSTGSTLHRFSWWICLQCYVIIRDLQAIYEHNNIPPANNTEIVSKIHVEIKPDNILHVNGGSSLLGSLKVSEKSHELVSSTGQQPQFINNTYQTYRAPEHDIDEISSKGIGVDTWAVGCLFAEFLTWAIGGKEAVEIFRLTRNDEDKLLGSQWVEDSFFFIEQSDDPTKIPKRKNSVDEFFATLIEDLDPETADSFFPEFFDFIRTSMLNPDRNARANAEDVEAFLKKRLEEERLKSSYWCFKGTILYREDEEDQEDEGSILMELDTIEEDCNE
ncbi:hypothetical protein HDV62DRAFT_394055 [Trichoderma sp. SZMC 28011]